MPGKLDGKISLITGASSGMGWAIAERFAAEGSAVVGFARREEKLRELCALIESRGGRAAYYAGDVSRWDDVQAAVAVCLDRFGGVDIVVHCAGYLKVGTVLDTTEEEYDRMMDVSAKGAFLLAKACVPIMRERGGGAFVGIASVSVLRAVPQYSGEGAAKAAMVAMYKSMALDHAADNIRFNCIAPSTIRTPMFETSVPPDQLDALIEEHCRIHPLHRIGAVEDIANAALFLASDDSSWTTGAVLPVDGGYGA